ncbi:flagellar associated protein [Gracilaria domingensis]|nr:flagellar associated protein [Gracilaria domingensis]
MAPTEKQMKASIKEGGKKGQDLAGMSDMGGVKFFSVALDTPNGQWELMDAVLEGMNKEVDPAADDRKGGAGHIGKCLLFADDKALLILCHVPDVVKELINQQEWFSSVIESVGATKIDDAITIEGAGAGIVLKAEMKADPDANKFPLKEREIAIGKSFEYLVSKELVRPEESDDDCNYAEMADIEW